MHTAQQTVVVNRPVEEVFEYVTDPNKTPEWQLSLAENRPSEKSKGFHQTTEVRNWMGKPIEHVLEVTEHEPNKRFAYKSSSGPLQFQITYRFEPVDEGTRLTVQGQAESGGFFEKDEQLITRSAERALQANLANLKDLLETRG